MPAGLQRGGEFTFRVYADRVAAIGAAEEQEDSGMGFLDDAMAKAKGLIDKNDEKVDDAIEKAGDLVDDKTGDKYADQINKGQDLLQEKTGEGDTNK